MTDRPGPSVCQLLADLHAYRVQTMAPADLQVNIDQRQLLEDTADRAAFVKAGDVVEPFARPEVHGETMATETAAGRGAGGPAALPLRGLPGLQHRAALLPDRALPRARRAGGHAGRTQPPGAASGWPGSRTGSDSASRWYRTPGTGWPAASASVHRQPGIPGSRAGPRQRPWVRFWAPAGGSCPCPPSSWSARTGWSGSRTSTPTGWCGPRRKPSSRPCARWSPYRPDRRARSPCRPDPRTCRAGPTPGRSLVPAGFIGITGRKGGPRARAAAPRVPHPSARGGRAPPALPRLR